MLKNLFSRIKSEKSSTNKNDDRNQLPQNKYEETSQIYLPQDQSKLAIHLASQAKLSENIVKGQISQVRYWANAQIPNIFAKVLSCPISNYKLLPHSKRKVKEIDLKKDKFPEYLQFMKQLLEQQLPTFNHILINHYSEGIGIMPHFDGPLYRDKVVVLSLGGPALISFQQGYSKETQSMKILLEDKSIHIFEQQLYRKFLHGIQNNNVDAFTFKISKSNFSNKLHEDPNLIKIKNYYTQSKEAYFINQSSIINMNKIQSIKSLIQKYFQRLVFKTIIRQEQKYCIQFDQLQGVHKLKGCFLFIQEDSINKSQPKENEFQLWKWKIQIQRQQRISITIRQKFQSTSTSGLSFSSS